MNAVEFTNVWKKFKVGRKFNSLRDTIPKLFSKPFKKSGELKDNEFWALRDVSFNVKKGEVLGIIGPNGAGKSTILKLLFRIMAPNKGTMMISGNVSGLIEVTAGFHPELTGRENVYLNGTILGMRKKEIDKRFEQIVDFSGVQKFIDTPVKHYSSGMYARLGFSVVAHLNPDVLLVDEVLAVGDMAFQAKCYQKMKELLNSGATIVLVSHNLSLVQNLCKRVLLLEKGSVLEEGAPDEVVPSYNDIVYKARENEFKKEMSSKDYILQLQDTSVVSIKSIFFYNSGLKHTENFKAGEPLSINIEFESKEKINNPVFSVDIIRPDGVLCCSSNSRNNGFRIDNIYGNGAVKLEFPKLNLAAGIYLVKVSIFDKDMVHPYAVRRQDIFKISAAGINNDNAIFLPDTKWGI